MIAYAFPGQGISLKGILLDLLDDFPDDIKAAERILCYSIKDMLETDSNDLLKETLHMQPLMYILSALAFKKLQSTNNEQPAFCIGHSLGELSALFAAGVYDFVTGLKIVNHRAKTMSLLKGGGMAAVVGLPSDKVERTAMETGIMVANYNTQNQTVVAGSKELVDKARDSFIKNGATHYVVLDIKHAFHTEYYNAVASNFLSYLDQFDFNEPKTPIYSNFNSCLYTKENTAELLSKQINNPVLWTSIISALVNNGVTKIKIVGPDMVLKGLFDNRMQLI